MHVHSCCFLHYLQGYFEAIHVSFSVPAAVWDTEHAYSGTFLVLWHMVHIIFSSFPGVD